MLGDVALYDDALHPLTLFRYTQRLLDVALYQGGFSTKVCS